MDEVVISGEEIVITKNDRPVSRLVPYREAGASAGCRDCTSPSDRWDLWPNYFAGVIAGASSTSSLASLAGKRRGKRTLPTSSLVLEAVKVGTNASSTTPDAGE